MTDKIKTIETIICFLYEDEGNLCSHKCDGHNTKCPQYLAYKRINEPYKVDAKYQIKRDRED